MWPPAAPVTVWRRKTEGVDGFGETAWGEFEPCEVVSAVYAPGATEDLAATRPEGVRVSATLHFPKGYDADLTGCEVELFGVRYRVVGTPMPYPADAVPGCYGMPVEVVAVHG